MPFSGDYDGSIVTVLEQLRLTADLEGLAVLDLSADAVHAPVAYSLGGGGPVMAALGHGCRRGTWQAISRRDSPSTHAQSSCPVPAISQRPTA